MARLTSKGTVPLYGCHNIAEFTGDDNEWLEGFCDENGLDYKVIAETPYRLTKVQSVAESGEARGAVYEVTIPTTGVTIGVIFSEYSRSWTQEASWKYRSRRHGDTVSRSWGYGADIEDARSPDNHTNYSESWGYALTRLIEKYAEAQGLPPNAGKFYTAEALAEGQAKRWKHWDHMDSPDGPFARRGEVDAGRPRVERPATMEATVTEKVTA